MFIFLLHMLCLSQDITIDMNPHYPPKKYLVYCIMLLKYGQIYIFRCGISIRKSKCRKRKEKFIRVDPPPDCSICFGEEDMKHIYP